MAPNDDAIAPRHADIFMRNLKLGYRIAKNKLSTRRHGSKPKKSQHGLLKAIESAVSIYGIKLTTAKQLWSTLQGSQCLDDDAIWRHGIEAAAISEGQESRPITLNIATKVASIETQEQHHSDPDLAGDTTESKQYEAFDEDWVEMLDIPDHQQTILRLEVMEVETLELLRDNEGLSIFLPAWKERGCAPSREGNEAYRGGDKDRLGNGTWRVPDGLVRGAGGGGNCEDEKENGGVGDDGQDDGNNGNGGLKPANASRVHSIIKDTPEQTNFGGYEDIESLQSRIFQLRREALGLNHPDTLAALTDLAQTMIFFGQAQEGENMEHEIAKMREEFLSASHSDSRPSVGTVGTNVLLRNRSDDSRAIEVLELSKDILDSTDPHTLMEAAKFGELQYLQGYRGEMEASLSQYLQEQSIPLQGIDIDVLLAHIRAQSYDEADRPFILNIEYKKRKLIRGDGPPLFDVVWYMQDLVDRWYASGRREQAASFRSEMCELKRQFLGDGGAQRMSTLEEHAKECYRNRQYNRAEAFSLELLALKQKVLGPRDPETIRTMNILSDIWNEQQQLDRTEYLRRQHLQQPQRINDVDEILSMHEQAQVLFREWYQSHHPLDHQETAQGVPSHEAKHLAMISEIRARFGTETTRVKIIIQELSYMWRLYTKTGQQECGHRMRRMIRELPEESTYLTGMNEFSVMCNLAEAYLMMGRFEKAESLICTLLEGQRNSLAAGDSRTICTIQRLIRIWTEEGRTEQAQAFRSRALTLMGYIPDPKDQHRTGEIDGRGEGKKKREDKALYDIFGVLDITEEDGEEDPEDNDDTMEEECNRTWSEDENEAAENGWENFGSNMEDEDDLFVNPWCL